MRFRECKFLIMADLERYRESVSITSFTMEYLFGHGFKYIFWFRINQYLDTKTGLYFFLRIISRYIRRCLSYKLGIDISLSTQIGPGFKIWHFSGIFINGKAKIGKHCSIFQGATLGEYNGAPVLGDYVFVGPGAKLIGNIIIGENSIIGANCVLRKSVPNNSVVVGIPGQVISEEGNLRGDRKDKVYKKVKECYKRWCPESCWNNFKL